MSKDNNELTCVPGAGNRITAPKIMLSIDTSQI